MAGPTNGKDPPNDLVDGDSEWIWGTPGSQFSTVDNSEISYTVKNSFKTAINTMTSFNRNGVVMNKLLAWMDIQKDMVPPDTWKAHLNTLYTDDEILETKIALFNAVGGDKTRIGTFKKH